MSGADRVETMAEKLAVYAHRAGAEASPLITAYRMSVTRRLAELHDVFHPDVLHPARTALILIQDTGCTGTSLLTAAALCESEFPALRVPGEEILAEFGPVVHQLVEAVPKPDTACERLLEDLVSASEEVATIAIAERLDHARHLHFRDPALWPPFSALIDEIYLPVAARVCPPLERRLRALASVGKAPSKNTV